MRIDTKYRWALAGFALMLILNLVLIGSLWWLRPSGSAGRGIGPQHRVQRMLNQELELSDRQQRQFRQLRQQYRQQMMVLADEMRLQRRALYGAVRDSGVTEGAVDSLSAQLADVHRQMERVNVAHFRQLRSLLDAGQQRRFDRMLMRMVPGNGTQGRMRRGRGMGPGR